MYERGCLYHLSYLQERSAAHLCILTTTLGLLMGIRPTSHPTTRSATPLEPLPATVRRYPHSTLLALPLMSPQHSNGSSWVFSGHPSIYPQRQPYSQPFLILGSSQWSQSQAAPPPSPPPHFCHPPFGNLALDDPRTQQEH